MKKFLFILLGLLIPILSFAVTFDVEGLRYNILSQQDKTVEVAIIPKSISYPSYSTYKGAFNIPATVTFNNVTYDVIGIGDHAFSECHNLEGVTLPSSIKHIGFGAFSNSNIEELILPEGVETVGAAAFYNCYNLTELCFPSTVTSLGENMFYKCSSLKKVTILSNNIESIPNYFLNTCVGITEFNIPTSVTSLGDGAFYMTSQLEVIDIPSGVTNIGAGCFQSSGVTSLFIPDGVTEFKGYTFRGCKNLVSLHLPSNISVLEKEMFNGCSSLASVNISDLVEIIPSRCFAGCTNLTEFHFPSSLKQIYDDAFNMSGIKKAILPEGLTKIGIQAFYGCSIDELSLPSTLTEVGSWAFGLGPEIKVLRLPKSLISIGGYAFDDVQLEEVICENPVPCICEEYIFKNETYLYATLKVPMESLSEYKATKPWSSFFKVEGIDMSGIENVFSDSDTIETYIDINGIESHTPFKGLNIIRYKSGKIVKVFVK